MVWLLLKVAVGRYRSQRCSAVLKPYQWNMHVATVTNHEMLEAFAKRNILV